MTGPQTPGWFSKPSVWLADDKLIFLDADGTNCTPPIEAFDLRDAGGLSGRAISSEAIFIANTGADELLVLKQPKYDCDGAGIVARLKFPFGGAAPKSFLDRPTQVVACPHFVSVWVTNGGSNSVSAFLYYTCPEAFPGAPFHGGGLADPEGIDCDNDGSVWIANNAQNANSITELESLPDSTQPISKPPCLDGTGRGDAYRVRVDALSPSSGFSGAGLNRLYGVAVDALGNVWVTNEGNDSLTVFIGAGGVPSGGRALTGG